jgi:hypothetical protein
MVEHQLSLRMIGMSDYRVVREARAVGRIRLSDEWPGQETWSWSITVPLPMPSFGVGSATSLEAAKAAFREAWETFYARLTADDVAHWYRTQDGARERAEWIGWS